MIKENNLKNEVNPRMNIIRKTVQPNVWFSLSYQLVNCQLGNFGQKKTLTSLTKSRVGFDKEDNYFSFPFK